MRAGEKKRPWTAEERAYVVEHYGRVPARVIGEAIGRSAIPVQAFARRHRLVKQEEAARDGASTPAQLRQDLERTRTRLRLLEDLVESLRAEVGELKAKLKSR